MNYTLTPPIPSDTRIARATKWLTLSIVWFTAHVLILLAPNCAKRQLERYGRTVQLIIMLKALRETPRPRAQQRRHHDFTPRRSFTLRRAVGSAVRRTLRGRTTAERARAIYDALTKPSQAVAFMKPRALRRLTKLRVFPSPPREIGTIAPTPAQNPLDIDSS